MRPYFRPHGSGSKRGILVSRPCGIGAGRPTQHTLLYISSATLAHFSPRVRAGATLYSPATYSIIINPNLPYKYNTCTRQLTLTLTHPPQAISYMVPYMYVQESGDNARRAITQREIAVSFCVHAHPEAVTASEACFSGAASSQHYRRAPERARTEVRSTPRQPSGAARSVGAAVPSRHPCGTAWAASKARQHRRAHR